MAVITYTAQKLTEPNIVREMSITTESRTNPNDATGNTEQYRAVMRLVIERDAFNISDFSQPSDALFSRSSIPCLFNKSEFIEIFPLVDTELGLPVPFKLIGQHFMPKNERGSKFFNLVQEYVSVTEWRDLEWNGS